MKEKILFIVVLILVIAVCIIRFAPAKEAEVSHWSFQSVDTMKYSRDLSREKLNDPLFDKVINDQVKAIAQTGATHIAIATPYDEEFYPILEEWVKAARKNNLKVWFRGNFSGWEGWFEYPKMTRTEHKKLTEVFIMKHKDIFEDGDIFTACPECENGGPGDPRKTGDVAGHRNFLISEYIITKYSFEKINKRVASNYNSMNGDVAKLVMDKKTTAAMDGIVTIDHYVATPEKMEVDIKALANSSGGKIVLGEFGAPIPDINGKMTEEEQADYISKLLTRLKAMPEVIGVSYWTNIGSSTSLWNSDNSPRIGVSVLTSFYKSGGKTQK